MAGMTYRELIDCRTITLMERHPNAVLFGVGVGDGVKDIFGTTTAARERFPGRVWDTPLSENMLTGAAVGMAAEGMLPIIVHARADFLTLAMEHLVNSAAKWSFVHPGETLPMIVRAIIGRGWGNGPTHTQAPVAWFANTPGIDVWMPVSTNGLDMAYLSALRGPRIIFEHRSLYDREPIPDPLYDVGGELRGGHRRGVRWTADQEIRRAAPLGPGDKGWLRPTIHLIGFSAGALDLDAAAQILFANGVRSFVQVVESMEFFKVTSSRHPRLIVDVGQMTAGLSAEIMAQHSSARDHYEIKRIGPPPWPCPASAPLEQAWYATHGPEAIANAAGQMLGVEVDVSKGPERVDAGIGGIRGPF